MKTAIWSFCCVIAWTSFSIFSIGSPACAAQPIDIGNRRELLVDGYVIDSLSGNAELRLHRPIEREIVMTHDARWEGNTCTYHTVFHDGDRYRMYYRASHNLDDAKGNRTIAAHPAYTCYAESSDGIHWTKPNLGLVEFEGSTANNIVYVDGFGNFAPFKDANPQANPDAKYKAVAGYRVGGLYAYQSPDGIHWKKLSDELVIQDDSLFDSLNVAFYDPQRDCYVAYYRDLHDGKRDIKTCTSQDFIHWTAPEWIEYAEKPAHHLYTNAIQPYFRAPHLLIGLPKRYVSNRNPSGHPARGVSDALLMTSRDGVHFNLWEEAIVRPGLQPGRWVNRNNLPAWGLVETESTLAGGTRELSMYTTEDYHAVDSAKLRRHTWRLDGFASLHAGFAGGDVATKPLRIGASENAASEIVDASEGKLKLFLNVSTSAAGSVRVELQDAAGQPIPGFHLSGCDEILGDELDRSVTWSGNDDLSHLSGQVVRVRFSLKDADIYAFQFRTE